MNIGKSTLVNAAILALIMASSLPAFAQGLEETDKWGVLKGNVALIITHEYLLEDSFGILKEKDFLGDEQALYDANGLMVYKHRVRKGRYQVHDDYFYFAYEKGKIMSLKCYSDSLSADPVSSFKYEYGNGVLNSLTSRDAEGQIDYMFRYEYGEDGIKETKYGPDGRVVETQVFNKDANLNVFYGDDLHNNLSTIPVIPHYYYYAVYPYDTWIPSKEDNMFLHHLKLLKWDAHGNWTEARMAVQYPEGFDSRGFYLKVTRDITYVKSIPDFKDVAAFVKSSLDKRKRASVKAEDADEPARQD